MRIVSVIVVCFAPCSGILVVGDVLEQCLVVDWCLGGGAFEGVSDCRSSALI
jgi:hypothetical protein